MTLFAIELKYEDHTKPQSKKKPRTKSILCGRFNDGYTIVDAEKYAAELLEEEQVKESGSATVSTHVTPIKN